MLDTTLLLSRVLLGTSVLPLSAPAAGHHITTPRPYSTAATGTGNFITRSPHRASRSARSAARRGQQQGLPFCVLLAGLGQVALRVHMPVRPHVYPSGRVISDDRNGCSGRG